MNKILKKLAILTFLFAPLVASAQETVPANIDVMVVLERIVNWLFSILLVIAAIYIVKAGITFVTAGGDPGKVETARNDVMYALIGVAVAILSRGLVVLVRTIVGT